MFVYHLINCKMNSLKAICLIMKVSTSTLKLVLTFLCTVLMFLLMARLYLLCYLYTSTSDLDIVLLTPRSDFKWQHAGQGPSSNLHDWSYSTTRKCEHEETVLKAVSVANTTQPNTSNNEENTVTVPFGGKQLAHMVSACNDGRSVPSVVHYVWMYNMELGILHFLSLLSVLRFLDPCLIVIHGPVAPSGRYYNLFLSLKPPVVHAYRTVPVNVGKHRLAFPEHSSDLMRIQALLEYGGIYLDFDVILLRTLDALRAYPYTQGRESPTRLGSQVILAEENAPFLRHWLESYYTDYRQDWGYNALTIPHLQSKKFPSLIHVEGYRFTKPGWTDRELIYNENYNWSDNFAIHLYARELNQCSFDIERLSKLNTTLGSVWRHVFYGNKDVCSGF